MGIRWLKMGKMSDKMRQDGAKMRNVRDVSSVLGLLGPIWVHLRAQEAKNNLATFWKYSGDGGP